jgi:type II secretory pathway component PulF
MNITAAISVKILTLVKSGVDVIDAMKIVCGTENVDKMICELHEILGK